MVNPHREGLPLSASDLLGTISRLREQGLSEEKIAAVALIHPSLLNALKVEKIKSSDGRIHWKGTIEPKVEE